jgi:nucleotide-binding universal stress UspA family protein/predicted transcriptional regulator
MTAGQRNDPEEPRVEEVMTAPLIRIGADDPLREAASCMAERGVHALLVEGTGGREATVVSDSDLIEALATGADPDAITTGEIAGTEAPTLERSGTLSQAAQLLDEHAVGHLLVLDPDGAPAGVVSTLDVLGALPATAASPPAAAARHVRRVVVAHEGAESGDDAVALARLLAGERGMLKAVTVMPYSLRAATDARRADRASDWQELGERLRTEGERMLAERALPQLADREASGEVLLDDSPARALSMLCDREGPDYLVFGSSHRGALGRILLGTTAGRLLNGVAASVAVAPRGYSQAAPTAIGRIAVGYDGSDEAERALREAAELASGFGAELLVIGVVEPPAVMTTEIGRQALRSLAGEELVDRRCERMEEQVADRLGRLAEGAPAWKAEVRRGDAVDLLRELTSEGVDLLVLGSRGYGPVRRTLVGSVSVRLLGDSPCPVAVIAHG